MDLKFPALSLSNADTVAPLVGAWIEINGASYICTSTMSLPLWERGLKYSLFKNPTICFYVAPLVGAWIEIPSPPDICTNKKVAPLVGAWIEIEIIG